MSEAAVNVSVAAASFIYKMIADLIRVWYHIQCIKTNVFKKQTGERYVKNSSRKEEILCGEGAGSA